MTGLEREIAAIEGVDAAQVETIEGAPVSVRLDLVDGADPTAVAGEVQALLRRHGLRTRLPAGPGPTPVEPSPGPSSSAEPPDPESSGVEPPLVASAPIEEAPAEAPHQGPEPADATTASAPVAAVVVRQARGGVDVTVESTDGRSSAKASTAHPDEVARAIVAAVAELSGRRPPRLVETTTTEVGGRRAVTVVLDVGVEDLAVGTVFEVGTADLALARAVWAALEG
ncbi:MAG: hypothetical protein AB1Z55_05425 [Acidimicrobiia bacterium]